MTKLYIEILVTGMIPDGNDELGHEAIVATKEVTQAVADVLTKLKLIDVKQRKRLHVKRPRDAEPAPEKVDGDVE